VKNSQEVFLSGISHLDSFALENIDRVVQTLREYCCDGFSATLEEGPHQHIGLGTKTSLLLALITAVSRLK
jgi:predicted sugar kinase